MHIHVVTSASIVIILILLGDFVVEISWVRFFCRVWVPYLTVVVLVLLLLTLFSLSFRCMNYAVDVFGSGSLMPFSRRTSNNLICWKKKKNLLGESYCYQRGKCESCKSGARAKTMQCLRPRSVQCCKPRSVKWLRSRSVPYTSLRSVQYLRHRSVKCLRPGSVQYLRPRSMQCLGPAWFSDFHCWVCWVIFYYVKALVILLSKRE